MKAAKKVPRQKSPKGRLKKAKREVPPVEHEGSCWIAASVGSLLFESFEKSIASRSGSKSAAIDQVFVDFARAWDKGDVGRLHLGVHEFEQKTFYVRNSTSALMRKIAAADGAPIAGVIRSAMAWNVERVLGRREFLGKRPKLFGRARR